MISADENNHFRITAKLTQPGSATAIRFTTPSCHSNAICTVPHLDTGFAANLWITLQNHRNCGTAMKNIQGAKLQPCITKQLTSLLQTSPLQTALLFTSFTSPLSSCLYCLHFPIFSNFLRRFFISLLSSMLFSTTSSFWCLGFWLLSFLWWYVYRYTHWLVHCACLFSSAFTHIYIFVYLHIYIYIYVYKYIHITHFQDPIGIGGFPK